MTTLPTTPPPLLFPAFLFGDRTTCQRKMKAEAKKWGKRYAEKGDFPEPALVPIPPGSIVFWANSAVELMWSHDSTADDPEWAKVASRLGPKVPRWHLYVFSSMRWEIPTQDDRRPTRRGMYDAFDAFACRYPWGAACVAMMHSVPNTIPVVTRRVEALLSFWEQLDTLRYMDHRLRPVSLTDLIAFEYQGEIAMWVDQPTGNVRADLRTAIEQMGRASEDEIRARLMRRLYALIDTERELNHREWLKTPGVIERELELYASDGGKWYDDLTTGNWGCLGGCLSILDGKYPDGVFKDPGISDPGAVH
jgi:hypothetical protein